MEPYFDKLFKTINPYIHTSTTMLNDQYKEAQSRPDLVVVEMEIPVSELDGVYRAEHTADPTGRKPWNAGVIQKYLTGTHDVILSRGICPNGGGWGIIFVVVRSFC